MLTILATLGTIAATLGLSRAIDYIDNERAKGNKVTSDDIIKTINAMTDEASSKSSKILDELNRRIANIDVPFSRSPALSQYITKVKNSLNNEYNSVQDRLNEIDRSVNNIRERSTAYSYQPDQVKVNMKRIPEELKREAQDNINKLQEIERSIKDA